VKQPGVCAWTLLLRRILLRSQQPFQRFDPSNRHEIARRIEQRSDGALHFTLASLYETLYRLEERGLIRGRWVERAGQRRRRYYRITENGRKVLAAQREDWARFIAALVQVAGVKPA
jgi:DNA-binding PadR family transcriptional regulator